MKFFPLFSFLLFFFFLIYLQWAESFVRAGGGPRLRAPPSPFRWLLFLRTFEHRLLQLQCFNYFRCLKVRSVYEKIVGKLVARPYTFVALFLSLSRVSNTLGALRSIFSFFSMRVCECVLSVCHLSTHHRATERCTRIIIIIIIIIITKRAIPFSHESNARLMLEFHK